MSSMVKGTQQRQSSFGYQVTKAWTLPGSATSNVLFTVTGGLVLITSFVGQVTTLIGSTATTLSLGLGTPGVGGTLLVNGIATATAVTSAEVGTLVGPQPAVSATAAGALFVGSKSGAGYCLANPIVVNSATITATTSANAGAGAIKWYLSWIPLDVGASVA